MASLALFFLYSCIQNVPGSTDIAQSEKAPAVSDKKAVQGLRDYFTHILAETKKCYEAGLSWEEAAFEVGYANFDSWLDRERVVANVATIYRELSGGKVDPAQEDVLRHMLRYSAGAKCPHDEACGCGKAH